MGAIVVVLVAAVVMLLGAVVVGVIRLLTAIRALRAAVDGTQQWLRPVLDELREGSQITSLELAQLQSNVHELTSRRGTDR